MDDLDLLLGDARTAIQQPEHRPDMVAVVILRCGGRGAASGAHHAGDRRSMRVELVGQLAELVPVKSYGACATNAKWPLGRERDKMFVMRRARFCLAFENALDPDYVTEKLFDCLRAGAVPLVSGGAHVREFVPPHAAIFIDDFDSVELLAAHLRRVDGDPRRLAEHRRWIVDHEMDGWRVWAERMRAIEASGVRCRLCEFVAQRQGLARTVWSEAFVAQVRAQRSEEAARVSAREEERRRGLAHVSRVKVEL